MPLAELIDLKKHFGGVRAIDGISFPVNRNEILGLIGPNGSGKTTAFNLISGVFKPTSGKINFLDKDITGRKAHVIAQMGLTRTFQQTSLWEGLTVLEHMVVGGFHQSNIGIWDAVVTPRKYLLKKKELVDHCLEILGILGLESFKDEIPGNLSYGHQKLLGVGVALVNNPQLLLLDEPAAGLNPTETIALVAILEKILARGISMILVEHDMKLVMGVCHRIVAINFGTKLADGTPDEVRNDEDVIKAYLGG
jgi:branched-chain amino acid transport system ATP-binding protein